MSRHIATESFTEQLFKFFEETFERVHGLYLDRGTSLFETLDSLTAEEASRRQSANSGSIAAKVEHVRFFLTVCDDSMRLNKVGKVN